MNDKPRQEISAADRIEPAILAQNALHRDLLRYVNGAVFSRSDVLRASLSPGLVLRRHAGEIIRVFHTYREHLISPVAPKVNIEIEAYRGKNPHVHKMMEYLDRHLKRDVIGAYVHGSLGTCEEIAYSDFDALVILKTDVFESPERLTSVAEKLRRAKTIMYKYDPLQHHGWFVLIEDDLLFHCEAYFPVELFRHAKLLSGETGRCLSIAPRDSGHEINETLDSVAGSVIRRIEQCHFPQNVYQLKSLTSEFMLLPALYVQRKTGAGTFKKFCFEEAKRDFDPSVWRIMDEVSKLRQEWDYSLRPWQRRIACTQHALRDYLVGRWAPAIPRHMKVRLTPKFYASIRQLALLMRDRFLKKDWN